MSILSAYAYTLGVYLRESGVKERRLREIEANPILPIYREERVRASRAYRLTAKGREIRYGKVVG